MKRPTGAPSLISMTISPVSPGATSTPSGSTILTLYCGLGLPIDPSLTLVPLKLPTVSVVSVWPKPSMISRPVAFLNCIATSGFNASPAVVICLTDEKSYLERSSLIIILSIVGGAQNVVI